MSAEPLKTREKASPDSLSLNIPGPGIDRSSAHVNLAKELEIEAKFFMPRTVARKLTRSVPFAQIEQRYFKREDVRPLAAIFLRGKRANASEPGGRVAGAGHPGDLDELSVARIRRTREPGQDPNYYIEFKGTKEGEAKTRISRREVSEPISRQQYKALKEVAIAGTIRKRRFAFSGTLTVDAQVIPVVAQIDCLQAAGKHLRKVKTDFDTVDTELHDANHIHALRAGQHSFSFLRHCVELSSGDNAITKSLTTRRLAKKGLRDEAVKAIKELETEAERPNRKGKS